MAVAGEILVLPFFGQGHLFPCIELCKHLSSRKFQINLIISSALSSSIPATLSLRHPLVQISEIPGSGAPPPPPPEASGMRDSGPPSGNPFGRQHEEMGKGIESLLSGRPDGSPRPVCVVIDVMMSWSKEIFAKFGIPTVAFFTSGACSAAMEYSTWKARVDELKPGETRNLPGLPDDVAVSYSDLERPPHGGPGASGSGPPGGPPPMGRGLGPGGPPPFGRGFGAGGPPPLGRGSGPPGSMKPFPGPPKVGGEPMWLQEVEGTIALMMNTSHDLEGPFLDYVGQQMGKPVWGVGPLLPEEYWNSAGSVLHDRDMRPKKQSSHSEEEVIQWLDNKPQGSVLYISFGSEVGPSEKEYAELASALEESNKSFIWVVRPGSGRPGPPPALLGVSDPVEKREEEGYYAHGLESKAGERGMIIRGWAPQLLILSHPSTGGFLTHCGWNSTVEAIGRGVPMLAWPIRGDQFFNAKLVVSHLKIGHKLKEGGMSEMVVKDDILKGIDKLMGDQEAKARALSIGRKFECGFPATSEAALNAFKDFLDAKTE